MWSNISKYLKLISGLSGVIILITGIRIAMLRSGLEFTDNRPISYLGIDPASAQLFSISLIVSAILFILFGLFIRNTFKVKNKFFTFLVIGQIGQLIAAIAPYGSNSRFKLLHTIAAFVLALTLPILIYLFAKSQNDTKYYKMYFRLFLLELSAFIVGIGLFIFTRGLAPLGEAMPALGFHLWIVVLTVFAYKQQKTL